MPRWFHVIFCLSVLILLSDTSVKGATADANDHLEKGKRLLATGQLADALSQFHAAIEVDPTSYVAYFRRAAVYLGMGKLKAALPDLSKVIELKPDFTAARIQRGNLLLKQGDFGEAKIDFENVIKSDATNSEARSQLDLCEKLSQTVKDADNFYAKEDYSKTIELLSPVIEHCPWAIQIRELRADSYLKSGDLSKAVNDLKATAKLIPDNTQAFLKISQLLYSMGEADDSLTNIRECLKLDADHKACHTHYTKVKKLAKQLESIREAISQSNWNECLEKANQILKLSSDSASHAFVQRAHSTLCTCMSRGKSPVKETIDKCTYVLDTYGSDAEMFVSRAEAHILNEQYESALADYQHAQETEDSNRIHEGIKRVQKLIKQLKKRDYYKILNVRRTANKAEIMRAYRKLAIKWHPDKYEGDDKKRAEKMFIDIAAAKEVLTDAEKRAKFDAGEDPLDAEEQAQQHNPFHGFNPFGAGSNQGFTFRFHFN
ncbi:unnamed protein product [Adineta ricciae]|uniref:J domain-containing protein n=1 Tax=Adineta ricciae TaxID=249248 RepID=A0A813P766_ADIRI|nr:unnamed protein product [Adineta ricciae]CAF0801000.1 unnamed protein product [Adineta ricciae]